MKLIDTESMKLFGVAMASPSLAVTNWLVETEPTIHALTSLVALVSGLFALVYIGFKIRKIIKETPKL